MLKILADALLIATGQSFTSRHDARAVERPGRDHDTRHAGTCRRTERLKP